MVLWQEMREGGEEGREVHGLVACNSQSERTCSVFSLGKSWNGISGSPGVFLRVAPICANSLVLKRAPGAGTGMIKVKSWSSTAETFVNRLDAEKEATEKETVPRV